MKEKQSLKQVIFEYVKIIVITLILTNVLLYFVQISRVSGDSMEPNYHSGNIVLVNKQFYTLNDCDYEDVVVVNAVFGEEEDMIIKRVIGKPGDTISFKGNQMYRNGKKLKEDYILEEMYDDEWSYTVSEGCIFVMGDNRNISADSRDIGEVNFEKQVVGKVFLKLF